MDMVRFRVIKGSHLLLGVAAVVLALVICLLAFRLFAIDASGADAVETGGSLVEESADEGAGTAKTVFASSAGGVGIEISVIGSVEEQDLPPENEHTDQTVPPDQLGPASATVPPAETAPRVLIYHTHTHEAYEQTDEDPYEALEAWRTDDEAHSVVRVGEELAELLRAEGCEVVHDVTDHELDDLSTAYLRSEETALSYAEPFDLYIDLHRDAYVEGMGDNALYADGVGYAKLMMLVGRGDNFQVKPHYEENYAFARALTDALNDEMPGICRDVLVKTNRYNQHVGPLCILVEAGNNRNTLVEALNAMQPLSRAIAGLLCGE